MRDLSASNDASISRRVVTSRRNQPGLWSEDNSVGLSEQARQYATEQRLLDVVFRVAYLGKPPGTYDPARDRTVIRQWLKMGRSEAEIQSAIEGLRTEVDRGGLDWIGKGERFTLLALVNTRSKDGVRLWDVAIGTSLRVEGPMPESLRDVLRKAVG